LTLNSDLVPGQPEVDASAKSGCPERVTWTGLAFKLTNFMQSSLKYLQDWYS